MSLPDEPSQTTCIPLKIVACRVASYSGLDEIACFFDSCSPSVSEDIKGYWKGFKVIHSEVQTMPDAQLRNVTRL